MGPTQVVVAIRGWAIMAGLDCQAPWPDASSSSWAIRTRGGALMPALAATYHQGANEEDYAVNLTPAERLVILSDLARDDAGSAQGALRAGAAPGFVIEQTSPGRWQKLLRCGDARALARRARAAGRLNAARPSPLRCLRLPLGLPLAVALYGCATVVVPTQVRFASLKPSPESVQMVDARPRDAREYREQGQQPDVQVPCRRRHAAERSRSGRLPHRRRAAGVGARSPGRAAAA